MKTKLLLLTFLFSTIVFFGQLKYPMTKTVDSSDTYFGISYQDKYRWLENLYDSDVKKWYREQADFTNNLITKISGREELLEEWKKLDELKQIKHLGRYIFDNKFFYMKTLPKETVGKLYYRDNMGGKEILIFDPKTSITDKQATFQSAIPSYDGKRIMVTYCKSGSEISTIRIFDVLSRKFLTEIIYPCLAGGEYWSIDNQAIIYTSLTTDDNKSSSFLKNNKVRIHKVGNDPKFDSDWFSNLNYPELNLQAHYLINGELSKRSPENIFVSVYGSDGLNIYYVADAKQQYSEHINWKPLIREKDRLVGTTEFIDNKVYGITSKNAPNYKLVSTNISNPDWENAEIIAPEKKDLMLTSFCVSKNFILMTYLDGINNKLFKYEISTKLTSEIKLPYSGTIFVQSLNHEINDCYLNLTSWNKPYTEFKLDTKTNSFSISEFNLPTKYPEAYNNIQVEEIEVKGHDGVMIPLSIIYKKGVKMDGSNVCFMEAYGSYGISMLPVFNNLWNSLVVKGVIVAIPHVRGGGEKGESWQKDGMKTTKPNTWKDFISCSEYLIAKGFTAPKKIVGSGSSAGGIMISRAVTERPDLYGAAISNVGVLNTLRSEKMPNGLTLSYHFGTVKDSIECRSLYEMDGLAHIKNNIEYPAFICVTGWNDPRVSSWQSGKFVAAMQAASISNKPILLKVNYDSGHFGSLEDYADFWSFALWQCGHPDFKLKK